MSGNRDNEKNAQKKQTMKGGTADFNWEDVRYMNYKDRECYLGYTVKIGFLDKGGKWKKKDWWTKGDESDKDDNAVTAEFMKEKMADEKRMRVALGLEDAEEDFVQPQMSSNEAREVFFFVSKKS